MMPYCGRQRFYSPFDRARMLELLDMKDDEILKSLNAHRNGLCQFLQSESYSSEDVETIISLLAKACHAKNSTGISRLFRTIFWYKDTFLRKVPPVIHNALMNKSHIDLPYLMQNYILILRHMLRKKIESFTVVREIFHQLQNYLNRMKSLKIRNLSEVIAESQELEKDLEKQEQVYEMERAIKEEPPENFRELSVMPRSEDVINYPVPYLRPNIVDGPYSDVDHYLDIHFRLMREDMLRSFRKAVETFRNRISRKEMELDGAYIYTKVTVHHPCKYTPQGILYKVSFKTPKVINWQVTKSFIQGSLICLTYDKFQNVAFAVVKDRQPQTGSSSNCQLKITLEHLEETLPERRDFVLVETTAYFEPYKHVLSSIKLFRESDFPFSDSIVYLDFEECESYLENVPFCLHEQCFSESPNQLPHDECSCKVFNVLDLNQWPTADELKLDAYQHQAFQTALSKNISLIQGPPGTGKTFLGVKIVKALLDNVSDGPIIVSCYTNHAVDQFLERILPYTNKVVRIGNQGKSEVLKPYVLSTLLNVVRQYRLQDKQSDYSFLTENHVFAKSFEVVKSLIPDIIHCGNPSRLNNDLFIRLMSTCREIEDLQYMMGKAEKEYFDDDVLNAMIDSDFKRQFLKGEGSHSNVLSRSIKGWLCLKNNDKLYQRCNEILDKSEAKRKNVKSSHEETGNHIKLWELPVPERFKLFRCWKKKCTDILKQKLDDEIACYNELFCKLDKSLDDDTYAFIKSARIIGMTTTGAAKYSDYLKAVKPRIVIIEEAAEVLESHIIACLVPSIQHAILIGDHEQLRPLPADHDLAVNYDLSISLFERLFKNGAPSATLCSQHRMRPCIAELLVPNIYKTLLNHDSVSLYENIKGFKHNIFFVQHSNTEDVTAFGKSFSNKYEAAFIANLCKYVIHQGYDKSQITVLTTYGGQQSEILKLADETLSGVQVTTVDNYQGEENDIILISFVRSNPSGVIGFLKESNRVCVALSRARKALYCIGNFEQYARRSELWASILLKLKENNVFDKGLPLQCQNHKVKVMYASDPNDFQEWLSNGCGMSCGYMLPCGHNCSSKCHLNDPNHSTFHCHEPCERMVNVDGKLRTCNKRCFEPCEAKRHFIKLSCGHRVPAQSGDTIDIILSRYKCTAKDKKFLPCGHLDYLPCYASPHEHKCNALVIVILPCGHEKKVPCHTKSSPGKVVCQEFKSFTAPCGHTVDVPCGVSPDDDMLLSYCSKSCDALLTCGHACTGHCRWCFGTNIHAMCLAPCDKRLPCGHLCTGKCDAPCLPCTKKCNMRCPHVNCVNPCEKPCVKCTKRCSWQCDHFKCDAECWKACSGRPCNEPCSSVLGCGHPCIGFCGEPCPFLCRICQRDMLDCDNPETDRFVLLENCDHVVEVNKLTLHINNKREIFEWPDCPVCSKIITYSTRYHKQLKAAKETALASVNVEDKIPELFFLLHTMFGDDYIIGWRFQDVHREIQTILEHRKPSAAALTVLENCLLFLNDLVYVDRKLNQVDDCLNLDSMLETLILWIANHLTIASYQQIAEVEAAVQSLKEKVTTYFGK